LRIPLQGQQLDLAPSADKAAAAFRVLMKNLERNWGLSAVLMLLAIVLLSNF